MGDGGVEGDRELIAGVIGDARLASGKCTKAPEHHLGADTGGSVRSCAFNAAISCSRAAILARMTAVDGSGACACSADPNDRIRTSKTVRI